MRYSACISMLFEPETSSFADRIRLAKRAGFDAVEFWSWTDKDLDAIEDALGETGLTLAGTVVDPMLALTDRAELPRFLDAVGNSVETARRLKTGVLISQAGPDLPGVPRGEQRAALTEALSQAAPILAGTGMRIALEPLNTRIDHIGYFLPSTIEGLDIVDDVNRPEIALLYDLYHSMVMDEATSDVLAGRVDRVAHIHLADHPGRNQPGTGRLDLKTAVDWLYANGYDGFAGLEYRPIGSSAASFEQTKRELGV